MGVWSADFGCGDAQLPAGGRTRLSDDDVDITAERRQEAEQALKRILAKVAPKEPRDIGLGQAEQSCGLGLGDAALPDVVLGVDHTTDIRRRKLGIYKESGFSEIWVLVPWDSSVQAPRLAGRGFRVGMRDRGCHFSRRMDNPTYAGGTGFPSRLRGVETITTIRSGINRLNDWPMSEPVRAKQGLPFPSRHG